MNKIKEAFSLIKETFQDWSEDKAPRLAAALAYYTVFSLAPLLVLVIAITGFVVGNNDNVRTQLLSQTQSLVGEEGRATIETMINQTSQPRNNILATVFGIGTLILGATGLFGQLQDALNTIWEVEPKKEGGILNMVKTRFLSFTMVLGICFLLLVSLVISAVIAGINTMIGNLLGGVEIIAQIINFLVSTGIVALIFAMIFKILPDVEIKWKDVWVGAIVTALLFNIGKTILGIYLGGGGATSVYGAAGSLVLILLWVYYSAQILFLGAEFTQVWARKYGSRLMPSPNAKPVTEEMRAQQGMTRQEGSSGDQQRRAPQPQGTAAGVVPAAAPSVAAAMIPVAGQPEITRSSGREKVRYEPPQPGKVVPVIALGAVSAFYTARRIVQFIAAPAAARKKSKLASLTSTIIPPEKTNGSDRWVWPTQRR